MITLFRKIDTIEGNAQRMSIIRTASNVVCVEQPMQCLQAQQVPMQQSDPDRQALCVAVKWIRCSCILGLRAMCIFLPPV
jgi:hypothetical protein